MKRLATLFGIAMSFSVSGQNGNWSSIQDVNDNASLGAARPRIALVNNTDPLVIWGDKSNYQLYISSLNATVWSSGQKVNPASTQVFSSDWAGPEIAADGQNVIITYKGYPEKSNYAYSVMSGNGGTSFATRVAVGDSVWTRFPTPAIDGSGKPYVAFMEFDSGFVDPHYSVSASSNGGVSFNSSVVGSSMAPGEVCDCCPAHISANSNHTVLFFRNNDNNLRDIWASVSTNSGTSFANQSDIDLNSWMINSCPSTGPDAILTDDSLICVWMSGASGSSRVNIATASLPALSLGRNQEMHTSVPAFSNQNYPRIAGNKDTLAVVWQETGSGRSVIKAMFSTSGVNGLVNAIVDTVNDLSDRIHINPDIAYGNGRFHITWQNSVKTKVHYRYLDVTGPLGNNERVLDESIRLYPNPSAGLAHLEVPESFLGGRLSIYDLNGSELFSQRIENTQSSINTNSWPQGLYLLRVQQGEESHRMNLMVK